MEKTHNSETFGGRQALWWTLKFSCHYPKELNSFLVRKLLKRQEEPRQMAPNRHGKKHPSVLLEKQQGKALRRNGAVVQEKAEPMGATRTFGM